MVRIIMGLAGIIVLAAGAFGGWYYRPGSDYSPAKIQAAFTSDDFTQMFRSMGEILPYRTINASESASPLARETRNDTVSYDWEGADKPISDWMNESATTGLIVMRDGVVVHEEYGLDADAETRHTSWSVGKSFVATLIAIAMEEGHIANLDQTAEMFAPQYGGTAYGQTTLRHLLMMSAGVDFNEDYGAADSDINNLFVNAAFYRRDIDQIVAGVERNREPGEDLHYVSANTQVLSAVVRGIYNAPLAEIVEEKLWRPLGMSGSAYWNQNAPGENGMAVGYCCLNAKLEDYARMGQFYLQDGIWEGERILPDGWVTLATRPNAPFQAAGPESRYRHRGYGLHFWVPDNHDGEYFMAGVYGQYVWVDERRGIVIARTAADPTWGPRTAESLTAMRAIAAHYGAALDERANPPEDAAEGEANPDE